MSISVSLLCFCPCLCLDHCQCPCQCQCPCPCQCPCRCQYPCQCQCPYSVSVPVSFSVVPASVSLSVSLRIVPCPLSRGPCLLTHAPCLVFFPLTPPLSCVDERILPWWFRWTSSATDNFWRLVYCQKNKRKSFNVTFAANGQLSAPTPRMNGNI